MYLYFYSMKNLSNLCPNPAKIKLKISPQKFVYEHFNALKIDKSSASTNAPFRMALAAKL